MASTRSVLFAALVGLTAGQYEGWMPGQISASMCYWEAPRAAVIRDTLWLDGGDLAWTQQLPNENQVSSLNNPFGLMLSFNFSNPFDLDTNLTKLIQTTSKAPGGSGPVGSYSPNRIDGALLHNDAEFYLYGGNLQRRTDASEAPDDSKVILWRLHDYGPEKGLFRNGSGQQTFPDGVSPLVTYGAGVSAPSENKAWYIGGMRSPVWGEIYRSSTNKSNVANTTSDSLITLDMSTQLSETFSNKTLEDAQQSPEFTQKIDIYDIAADKWYQQETTGGPGAVTRGCAVLATAADRSSFNLYYYGGYPGISLSEGFSDAVWVLSMPSFQWIKLNDGKTLHARAGHQCVMPYPDQMLVIGGYAQTSGAGNRPCVQNFFHVFNVSSGEWQDSYSPSKWSNYTVPTAVQSKIGGDAQGSATATTPVVSGGWADPSLSAVFAAEYTTKINTWYPYTEAKETDRPIVDDPGNGNNNGGSGGTPKWVAPVLGVVLGLVFITGILVGFCLWRRRKVLRQGNGTATATDDNGSRIISWIRGQPNTSPRAELHGVGLTPVEIINKHTHFGTGNGSNPGTTHQSSYYASVSSNENASSLSRSSGVLGFQTRAQSPEPGPPSPPVTHSTPAGRHDSDVSGLSDNETRHLRHISQATVSSASSGGEQEVSGAQQGARGVPATVPETPTPGIPETPTPGHPSPLSPPTGASDGEDYISARMLPVSPAGTGTLRRSMFHESEDDLGSKK
ncbi:Kelch repeat-containing protein [Colletotrichum siamense]|uniref:Kelch repeat-containing protein n=1 Tax=Colletotrichum siamense TaxID=690259 RepID=UPI001872181F|nr:Kelch repeat-containing protein [Colletotrichum siamense]KAF5497168.1 Kelch repeat-containing protein [Colletotrichum siamense]